MMGHRTRLLSGDEWDCLYGRRVLCVFSKSRVSAKTKRKIRRRERHLAKRSIRREVA